MRTKLILSFALVVLVSIVSFAFVMWQSAAREVNAFMYRGGMTDEADLVAELENYYTQNASWEGVAALLPGTNRGRGRAGGGMMGGTGQTAMGMSVTGQRFQLADADGQIVFDSWDETVGNSINLLQRWEAIPLHSQDTLAGYLIPSAGSGSAVGEQNLLIERLNRASLTAALVGGGLALLLAVLLAYRLNRPVQALTSAAEKLAAGDLTPRVAVSGRDELALLGSTFNEMATSLQDAEQSRRALTADIAHELRTPLSVQKAYLEALEDGIYPLTIENLQPIADQNQILNRLVNDLRTLAMADAGQLQLDFTPTNLAPQIERTIERFQPQADAKNIRLELTVGENIPEIYADPIRIEQILGNLVSNALRHTPDGGRISFELTTSGAQVRVQVRDSGPGIPAEALDLIFERFYRADRARSRAAGGSGLGLAIARQLALAHGGTLTARNHPQGGALFELVLPIQPESSGKAHL
ncbi:MAG: ATP-binding protein [Anaerolineales bacterium]|jgi:two-component system sensor histidine kinase BaeS